MFQNLKTIVQKNLVLSLLSFIVASGVAGVATFNSLKTTANPVSTTEQKVDELVVDSIVNKQTDSEQDKKLDNLESGLEQANTTAEEAKATAEETQKTTEKVVEKVTIIEKKVPVEPVKDETTTTTTAPAPQQSIVTTPEVVEVDLYSHSEISKLLISKGFEAQGPLNGINLQSWIKGWFDEDQKFQSINITYVPRGRYSYDNPEIWIVKLNPNEFGGINKTPQEIREYLSTL